MVGVDRRGRALTASVLAATMLSLGACAGEDRSVPDAAQERAREALAPFKQELLGALLAALEEGGPEEAIRVCRLRAPEIAASAGRPGEIEIGRTSHRLRNPENAPAPWLETLLERYREHPTDTAPRAVRLDPDWVGYVEPIHMKRVCLACHGPEVASPVRARLEELYPEDRATGFREGDFRGLFWVKLKLRESA